VMVVPAKIAKVQAAPRRTRVMVAEMHKNNEE
jgi:hypothetical protein